jgi:hypothetical protein
MITVLPLVIKPAKTFKVIQTVIALLLAIKPEAQLSSITALQLVFKPAKPDKVV